MLEDKIYNFGRDNNILIGICDAEPLSYMEPILKKIHTPFTERDTKKRTDPARTMPDCKSIIVIGVNYNKKLAVIKDSVQDAGPRGNISICAVGEDYHGIVMEKLTGLKEILPADADCRMFVDTGPLIDRELAKKAGLGWQGKHCSVISDKFGSLFFIGYMLLNLPLTPSKGYAPDFSLCGECLKCIAACPTKALSEDGFDYTKCISYLTQSKNDIDEEFSRKMGVQIYGCDICGGVCPHNTNVCCEAIFDYGAVHPLINDILTITDEEFQRTYKKTAAGWRGKKIFQRNAALALKNLSKKGNV